MDQSKTIINEYFDNIFEYIKFKKRVATKCLNLYTQIENLPGFYIDTIDRTTLKNDLKEYWVGKTNSFIGLAYLDIDWTTRKIKVPQFAINRSDIIFIRFEIDNECYTFFVEPTLEVYLNGYDPEGRTESLMPVLKDYVIYCLIEKYFDFIDKQFKWYKEKPWKKLDGLTPEEAVNTLEELGW